LHFVLTLCPFKLSVTATGEEEVYISKIIDFGKMALKIIYSVKEFLFD
jgi:hypothetical protein